MFDVSTLGQVFTPPIIVDLMLSLRNNKGKVLEPSSGDGAFSKQLSECISIEIDPRHASERTIIMDFFDFQTENKFETIIGNPPYVRYQDITESTKLKLRSQLFDSRSNLYLFFIEKCLDHLEPSGEIIFIVPRDFLKSTSSRNLNKLLHSLGTITDLIDLGDSKIFTGAVPNCVIFRFELGNFNRSCRYLSLNIKGTDTIDFSSLPWKERVFSEVSGQLLFTNSKPSFQLLDIAEVKVGAVSGLDRIFVNEEVGNREFVYSETAKSGKTRKMIWVKDGEEIPEYLQSHKSELLARKIRTFDESNWWTWGRGFPQNDRPRVYVNAKTRNPRPFYVNSCNNFDGSVLAIFPKYSSDIDEFAADLNLVNWDELGFFCDGRFLFSQRSLETAPLPELFQKYRKA